MKKDKSTADDFKLLIKVLRRHKQFRAVKTLNKYRKEIEKFKFLKTIKNSEHEVITIISPPVSEKWTIFIRNFKKGTAQVYNSDGLQRDKKVIEYEFMKDLNTEL